MGDRSGSPVRDGIDEDMSIDCSLHSLFGASKVAADVSSRSTGATSGCGRRAFAAAADRAQPLGAELHGFLAYLMRCVISGRPTRSTATRASRCATPSTARPDSRLRRVLPAPRAGEVYNIGGGRFSNARARGDRARAGDRWARARVVLRPRQPDRRPHLVIGDNGRFESHYPEWRLEYDVRRILQEIHDANVERWRVVDNATPG